MPQPQVHVVVISWQGRGDAARAIAAAVAPVADGLSVVYSNAGEHPEAGPGDWVQVPDSAYFGPKFQAALAHTPPGAVLLLIHADTTHHDWPTVVERCRAAYARHARLGVWAPEVGDTPYRTAWVSLLPQPGDPALVAVMQTDGIVFALAPEVQQRLRAMDYAELWRLSERKSAPRLNFAFTGCAATGYKPGSGQAARRPWPEAQWAGW